MLVAALLVVLASCAGPSAPAPPAPAAPVPPAVAAMLDGWELTLPVAGSKGDAEIVSPATVSPPWLTADSSDHLVFWAPVNGVTTKNSEHARTELDRLENFTAGSGPQTLTASVTVAQVPTEVPEVIIGQIHGAGDISSIPFVMMFYDDGAVKAVVKQEQSGDAHTDVPLLPAVPLGRRSTTRSPTSATARSPSPPPTRGRRCRAAPRCRRRSRGRRCGSRRGPTSRRPSAGDTAAADDGARVTFSAISVGTGAAPTG